MPPTTAPERRAGTTAERGATAVEYAFIATLVAVGIAVAVAYLGDPVVDLLTFAWP